MKPNKHNVCTLNQICQLIPSHLVKKLSIKHGIKSRKFSPWSHVVTLLYSQFSHALSLNDICDGLQSHSGSLHPIRNASVPKRNTLSHANRTRNASMAEDLFWEVLKSLQTESPQFIFDKRYKKSPNKFKRNIYAVDSTTIQLVANCMDWAKHRRRKAAAKCHMQLNLNSFLPTFAIIKAANTHDSTEAKELCSNIKEGEIVVFDKAYVDYKHLHSLNERGVNWVTRAKDNMNYKVVKNLSEAKGTILRDQQIELTGTQTQKHYPVQLRLVEALVEVDNKIKKMVFITNNFIWAPSSITDLYKSRWAIEVFFKQIKQNLQISDFLGHNENAIKWQIWMALLAYVLLRYLSFKSKWKYSFSRIFTAVKSVLWSRLELYSVLNSCGTANSPPHDQSEQLQLSLPGFNFNLLDSQCP